jgi:hypothetical protein
MRCDHLHAVALGQITIQSVTVVASAANQSPQEGVEEAVSDDDFRRGALVRRGAIDTHGERKNVITRTMQRSLWCGSERCQPARFCDCKLTTVTDRHKIKIEQVASSYSSGSLS